ncbi:MAG: hypothetical protein V3U02_05125 [Calditrichia bacterium]
MFKEAIRTALKAQGRTSTWLACKINMKKESLWRGLKEGHNPSVPVVEKCFETLGITLNIPDD